MSVANRPERRGGSASYVPSIRRLFEQRVNQEYEGTYAEHDETSYEMAHIPC